MSIVKSLNASALTKLFPRTLYDFGQYLSNMGGSIKLPENKLLAEVDPEKDVFTDEEAELEQARRSYFNSFLIGLERIEYNDDAKGINAQIASLLDDVKCCENDEIVEILAQFFPDIKSEYYPALEFVVRVLLLSDSPQIISSAAKKAKKTYSRGFHYYGLADMVPFPDNCKFEAGETFNSAYQAAISEKLQSTYGTQIWHVTSSIVRDTFCIEIMHGSRRQKIDSEQNAQAKPSVIRPIVWDVIHFNMRTKEIRIHMEKRSVRTEKNIYIWALSKIWTDLTCRWAPLDKFDLSKFQVTYGEIQAMMDRASNLLSDPVHGIGAKVGKVIVWLTDVSYTLTLKSPDGYTIFEKNVRESVKKYGLSGTHAKNLPLVPLGSTIDEVTLSIRYGTGRNRKTPSVTIKPDSKSENDLYMLDEWLEDEEVSIVPEVFKRQIADA